jgi:hypothetical protein
MSEQLVGLESESVKKILNVTDDIQIQRKLLIALSQEKVSHYQYAIVFILAVILLTNLVLIDSYQLKVESVMKAVFVSIIFVVIWTLNRFDNSIFPTNSAQRPYFDVHQCGDEPI